MGSADLSTTFGEVVAAEALELAHLVERAREAQPCPFEGKKQKRSHSTNSVLRIESISTGRINGTCSLTTCGARGVFEDRVVADAMRLRAGPVRPDQVLVLFWVHFA